MTAPLPPRGSSRHAMDRLIAGERPESFTEAEVQAVPAGGMWSEGPPLAQRPMRLSFCGSDPVEYLWWTDRYWREDVWPGHALLAPSSPKR